MRIAPAALLLCVIAALAPFLPARAEDKDDKPAPSERDRIYLLQHRILPHWTFQSGGAFFRDLKNGSVERLLAAARDLAGEEFAQAIKLDAKSAEQAVLIIFPPPKEMALCYAAVVMQLDGEHAYYTLELTEDIMRTGAKTVLGSWSADGAHRNHGTRTYVDPSEFLKEVLAMQRGAPVPGDEKPEKK